MKTILLFTLLFSGFAFAQTNVIAAKSHASDALRADQETDNFGGSYERFEVYKVQFLKKGCLVEMSKGGLNGWEERFDTLCDHPFLSERTFNFKRIAKMYPDNTEFVDFDKLDSTMEPTFRYVKPKKSGTWLIFVMSFTGLGLILNTELKERFRKKIVKSTEM